MNLLERLRASVGFRNFDGASEIFRSVCEMYGTKKILHEKTLPSVCTNRIRVSAQGGAGPGCPGRGVNRKHHPAERCDLRFENEALEN